MGKILVLIIGVLAIIFATVIISGVQINASGFLVGFDVGLMFSFIIAYKIWYMWMQDRRDLISKYEKLQ